MDKNRVEGKADSIIGKVEDTVGQITGDLGTQVAGKVRQAGGAVQENYGKALDQAGSLGEQLMESVKESPFAAILISVAIGFLLASYRRRSY